MALLNSQKTGDSRLPIVAVNAIIVTDDNRFILTQRADTGRWCLPGGLVEFGETIQGATVREVKEEIGIDCVIEKLVGIYSTNNLKDVPIAKRNSIIIAFKCRIEQGVPGLSDEVTQVGFFNLENIPDTIIQNQRIRISHALYEATPIIE